MVDIKRSTFGYLQFDTLIYKDSHNKKIIPITFIDIEGATDNKDSQSIGNYMELITKADCDLYIIAFDKPFNDHNRTCQEYIESTLGRKCLLVRSKADSLFNQFLLKATNKKYEKNNPNGYDVKLALSETERYALVTSDDKRLFNKVYLTAAAIDNDLKDAPFALFDLNQLEKELVQLAVSDTRVERICRLAILASRATINTCFRRGYVVSKTRYQWLAAGASIVPFLDELPAFFGREKIRQAFGIHDNSAMTNAFRRTKDSLEKYLIEKKFTVPTKYLKSGYFKYLICNETDQSMTNSVPESKKYVQQKQVYSVQHKSPTSKNTQVCLGHTAQTIGVHTTVVLGALGKVADDAARLLIPSASVALRAISITGIVVGAVLTPVFAAWTFYSTGQRMSEHLHLLCDDLLIILGHFIIAVCNDSHQHIQLATLSSSDEESSSSEDE
jgi:hypothetical protein